VWRDDVPNRSGVHSWGEFLEGLLAYFESMNAQDWLMFGLKLGVFVFLFIIAPYLLRRYGGKGWQ
jgi:uncharacterized membrane protein